MRSPRPTVICTGCGFATHPKKPPPGARCSRCGSHMQRENSETWKLAAEAMALLKVRELVAQWTEEGLIARPSAEEIQRRLSAPAPAPVPPPPDEALAQHVWHPPPEAALPPPQPLDPEPELPQTIGALEALTPIAALDLEPPRPREPGKWETEVRPLLYENIGWFIGTLLVLAGSVYGVREAWRTLGGIPRHITVGGALFAYHAGFVGLAALLAKKSKGTGAVLGAIALGLSPIVFVALSSMVETNLVLGGALSLPFVFGSFFTLRSVGKRFDLDSPGLLAFAVLPALIAELPVGTSSPDSVARAGLPFVGVATARFALRSGARAVEIAALYVAIALGIYAVVGGPTAAASGPLAGAAVPLFCASLAGVLATGVERSAVRASFPRLGSLLAIVALSVALVAVVLACRDTASSPPRLALFVDAATALVACGSFVAISPGRPRALHVASILAPVCGFLVARAMIPASPQWGAFGMALGATTTIVAAGSVDARARRILSGWGTTGAIVSIGTAFVLEAIAGPPGHWVATFSTALVVALAAHGAGGVERRGLHYVGGLAVIVAALAWLLPVATDAAPTFVRAMIAAAAGFAIAGVPFDMRAAMLGEGARNRARPFEDLSAFALSLAFVGAASFARNAQVFALAPGANPASVLRGNVFLAVIGVGFVLRALRDRSAFSSLVGAVILGTWVYLAFGARSSATHALSVAAIAFGAAVVASVRGTSRDEPKVDSRRVFGAIPLPFAARGRRAIADGFAHASFLATALALLACFGWLSARIEPERQYAVLAGALLVGAQVLGFFGGAFGSYGLRGSITSLSFVVALIGVAAVTNRIGRPLPPPVVGMKLSAVAVAMWAVALGARRYGARIGRALGDEASGARYHVVFHVIVFLLAAVMTLDALLVSGGRTHVALSVVPPLLVLGPALALVLEARTLRAPALVHVAAPLSLAGAATIAAQRGVLGNVMPTILPPEIAWPRGLFGVAVCGALLGAATLGVRDRKEATPTSIWVLIVAFVVLAASWLRVDPLPSALVLASGLCLVFARKRAIAQAVVGLGAFLIVHAAAQIFGVVPWWAGPAVAAIGGAASIATPGGTEKTWAIDALASAAIAVALVYALGEGTVTSPVAAGPRVVFGAISALDGRWMSLRALPITAGIAGATVTVAAFRAKGARVSFASFAGSQLLALGAASACVVFAGQRYATASFVVRMIGPTCALALAMVAAAEHGVGAALDATRRPSHGARAGRDLLLLCVFAVGALFVLVGSPPSPPRGALLLGFAAIAIASGTATIAAFRERSGRHVYYVQLAIVAAYALVRTELAADVPKEGDALFALCLGFLLLGVTVHARRAGIPEIAAAVRTFVALLPFGIALIMPRRATDSAAVIAAASGALYGALAWLERSRLFGSLGAAACNIALLLLALSHGIDGGETYLATGGLFVLALGHLFASTIDHGGRVAVRVVGALLLYAPAAVRLTSQLAQSPSGTYAVGFGAACLVGVILGMLLQIRAYLAFGTGFLVLDVIANLTAAGIRDHRVGFLVLSLAGLSILGTMVFVTLQRERFRGWARSLRIALRGWD